MAALKRTPCVGICSTTYGDLVCRGCKRFAHEIVSWNGYDEDQRQRVWLRLYDLLDGAVASAVEISDEPTLRSLANELRIVEQDSVSLQTLAFEVLRRCARRGQSLQSMGLASKQDLPPGTVLEAIEQEYFERSLARYEHDFRTLAK